MRRARRLRLRKEGQAEFATGILRETHAPPSPYKRRIRTPRVKEPGMSDLPAFSIDGPLEQWIARNGRITVLLRHGDPGCFCLEAVIDDRRVFVRQARSEGARLALARVVRVYERVKHAALPPLWGYWMASDGPFAVFKHVAGKRLVSPIEVLAGTGRHEAGGPYARFRALPLREILAALDTVWDFHQELASRGFVSGDFSDASLLYDFRAARPWVVHLDEFREEPLHVGPDPRRGHPTFLAPEELQAGAALDQRTSVFHLGRTALAILGDGSGSMEGWRAPRALGLVVEKALQPEAADRFQRVRDFVAAWRRESLPLGEPPLALPPPSLPPT